MHDFSQKELSEYFSLPVCKNGFESKSYYMAALIDARKITGREWRNGRKKKLLRPRSGSWAGALTYMVLIDHIGTIFSKNGVSDKPEFKKALQLFTNLSMEEIDILYKLRCSFAHNYSLFEDTSKCGIVYRFTVTVRGDLIQVRKRSYNLIHSVVNLEKLGNLVESIHKDIVDKIMKGEISLYESSTDKDIYIKEKIIERYLKIRISYSV